MARMGSSRPKQGKKPYAVPTPAKPKSEVEVKEDKAKVKVDVQDENVKVEVGEGKACEDDAKAKVKVETKGKDIKPDIKAQGNEDESSTASATSAEAAPTKREEKPAALQPKSARKGKVVNTRKDRRAALSSRPLPVGSKITAAPKWRDDDVGPIPRGLVPAPWRYKGKAKSTGRPKGGGKKFTIAPRERSSRLAAKEAAAKADDEGEGNDDDDEGSGEEEEAEEEGEEGGDEAHEGGRGRNAKAGPSHRV